MKDPKYITICNDEQESNMNDFIKRLHANVYVVNNYFTNNGHAKVELIVLSLPVVSLIPGILLLSSMTCSCFQSFVGPFAVLGVISLSLRCFKIWLN